MIKDIAAERIRELVDYDRATGKMFWKERAPDTPMNLAWNIRNAGNEIGHVSPYGYRATTIDGRPCMVHRLVWLYEHGSFAPEFLDHINGKRDDNRIVNLRPVDMKGNGRNQQIPSRNTSGVMGVSWTKSKSKWFAQITVSGKNHNLGRYHDIADAIAARKRAEVLYGFHPNHGRPANSKKERAA